MVASLLFRESDFASASEKKVCGSGRIIGGEEANLGEFPYQIQIDRWWLFGNFHACGGVLVLINNIQVVITAAQCTLPDDEELFHQLLYAGDVQVYDRKNSTGQTRQIMKQIKHENYTWEAGEYGMGPIATNDIAIMIPDQPFDLSDPNVAAIALPSRLQNSTGDAIVSGWGSLDETSTASSPCLRKVSVSIVPDDVCKALYVNNTFDSTICAGDLEAGGKDRCMKDIGDPLVSLEGKYLVGIASWGKVESVSYPKSNLK